MDSIASSPSEVAVMASTVAPFYLMASSFMGVILAGVISYLMYLRQRKLDLEIDKLECANEIIVNFASSYQTLQDIKFQYIDKVTDHVLSRFFHFPDINIISEHINIDLARITKICLHVENSEVVNITNISRIIYGYNYIMDGLRDRHKNMKEIQKVVLGGGLETYIELEMLKAYEPRIELVNFLSETQYLIELIDNLMIDMAEFIKEFEEVSCLAIDKKLTKNYGVVMSLGLGDDVIPYLKKTRPMKISSVKEAFGSEKGDLAVTIFGKCKNIA